MLNFYFLEKSLGIVSAPTKSVSHAIFYELIKFHCLVAFTSSDIVYFLGCDIINFEINLIVRIKPFFYMTKKSRQKSNILRTKTAFKMK